MDTNLAQELLDELLPSMEALEAQSAAILQFLKDRGVATDEQLAPYFEQAATASNVRWRAARLRMNRVLALSAERSAERSEQLKNQQAKSPAEVERPESERANGGAKEVDSEEKKTTEAADSMHKDGTKDEAGEEKENRKDEGPRKKAGNEDTPSKREQKDAA
ncbi:MAG: hypothetical protein JO187_07930 [Acidobacteria bacterium]|nr:hypothetical protein [Acidobacteriaceae bacterium]MBV9609472.1 hypothetical protein [Acidobacteriota bacterium]